MACPACPCPTPLRVAVIACHRNCLVGMWKRLTASNLMGKIAELQNGGMAELQNGSGSESGSGGSVKRINRFHIPASLYPYIAIDFEINNARRLYERKFFPVFDSQPLESPESSESLQYFVGEDSRKSRRKHGQDSYVLHQEEEEPRALGRHRERAK